MNANSAQLAKLLRHISRSRLYSYEPYPKQREFHTAGGSYRERLLMAGNRQGKTYSAGFETAMHATGWYPDWWAGRRFDRPVLIWCGAESNEASREIVQKVLLGTTMANKRAQDFGTGAIPGDLIEEITTRQAGVKDVVDQIVVRRKTGKGKSRLVLKTYEQERPKWQGAKVDVVWLDEEPNQLIYSEALTRTMDQRDGVLYMTFTPLLGMSEVVTAFLQPEPGSAPKQVTNMTIYDAAHFTDEQREEIIASYPSHERDTRAMGVPMMGEGRVFSVDEDMIKFDRSEIRGDFPHWWSRIAGLDFGIGHPCGIVWCAWDRDTDTLYVYDEYREKGTTPGIHAIALNQRGQWIPVAWPHDGHNRDKGTGKQLHRTYRNAGANLMSESARFDDDAGGPQSTEQSNGQLLERMQTGRLKIAKTCTGLLEEIRMYHRKDGKVVAERDDLIRALGYAEMELRHAKVPRPPARRRPRYTQPIV